MMHGDILGFEENLASRSETRIDEIFHHLRLSIDSDATAAGEFFEVDAVPASLKPQLDPVVDEPFPFHTFAYASPNQQLDGILLQHARANPFLYVFAASTLQHNGLDPLQM
jgi:hypothetical protein